MNPAANEDLSHIPKDFPAVAATVPGRLKSNAVKYFPELVGRDFALMPLGQKTSSYPMLHFSINAEGVTKGIFVKFAPFADGFNEGLDEYDNLRRMEKALSGKGLPYSSPRPLDFWHDIQALVMEEFYGEPLKDVLFSKNTIGARQATRDYLAGVTGLVGQWLSCYHHAGGLGKEPFDGHFPERAASAIKELKEAGFSGRPLKEAMDAVDTIRTLARDSRANAPIAPAHGDVALDNVLVRDNSVCVLDLSYRKTAPVYEDVAAFSTALETINPYPSSVAWSYQGAKRLKDSFIKAYLGARGLSKDEALMLNGYTLTELMRRCAHHLRSAAATGPLAGGLVGAVVRRKYIRLFSREVESLRRIISA
ncbi:MAG: hypothetical protein AABZ23_05240 [Deltaproteobacteria bacterium]